MVETSSCLCQLFAFFFGLYQSTEKIIGRRFAPLGNHRPDIVGEFPGAFVGPMT